MALSAVVNLGTNGNTGSTTITVSPSRNIEVGEFIVVLLSERDNGITSVADNSSQAGTANSYTQDQIRNNQDPFTFIYSCQVTRKILTTDVITATFAAVFGGKGMCVLSLTDADNTSQLDKTTDNSAGTGATYTSSAVTTTAQADEYAVGVAAFSISGVNAGTITADSPWTLQHNYKPAGYGYAAGSQVLTATGTPAFTGGWGATQTGQQTACIATYKGTAAGPFVYTKAGYGSCGATGSGPREGGTLPQPTPLTGLPWPVQPSPNPNNFLDHFLGSSLDSTKWTSVVSGTGAVTVTDSYLRCNCPTNSAAFVYYNTRLDKTKSQLWLICASEVTGNAAAEGPTFVMVVNGASAPAADTTTNILAKTLIRRVFDSGDTSIQDEHFSSASVRNWWNAATPAWETANANSVTDARTDDYYIVGLEIDAPNSRWRLVGVNESFGTAGTYEFDQGPMLVSITDWVTWANTRSNTDLWLVLGNPYNNLGATREIRVEWARYLEANGDARVFDGWFVSKDALTDGHRIKHTYSYDGKVFLPDSRTAWALDLGGGSPDNSDIQELCAVYDGVATDYMFYTGISSGTKSICVASAAHVANTGQGQTAAFTRYASNPILSLGAAGAFDEQQIGFACVVCDMTETNAGKRWKMLYTGQKVSDGKRRMGYATAPTATGPWTKQGQVLDVGSSGQNDEGSVYGMTVLWANGQWEVWYEGVEGTDEDGVRHLMRATGTDLGTLTKDGVTYYTAPTATASQSLTANLTTAPGRTVTVASTTGYEVDAAVVFSQDNTNDNWSASRVRKIASSTSLELYHGVTGFTTTYPAKVKQIASSPNFTPRRIARVGSEWWFYMNIWEPFHNAPEANYDSLLEEAYLFTHSGLTPAGGTPAIDHAVGAVGFRTTFTGRRSFENLTFLNEPFVDSRPQLDYSKFPKPKLRRR